jgi:ABC-type polysaccharide/polyol phosphate export permease
MNVCYNALFMGTAAHPARGRVPGILAPWVILSSFVQKIYIQRGLIRNFVARDLRTRYIGSFMGFFWSVIHPLVLLVSYTFVFSLIFDIRPRPETGTTSFPVFLFCSILPWLFFQDTLQRSSTVIIDNTNLVTKTIFPTEILPLSIMLAAVVNHAIGFAILLGIILFTIGSISVYIVFVPVYFFILMLFTLGAAWFVASLNVFIRDTAQVLSVVLTFWFWFTPIFYTPDRFPPDLLFLVRWNPLAHVVIAYRDCLLRMCMPDLGTLALLAATSLAIFALGGLFFRYTKREFVDVL